MLSCPREPPLAWSWTRASGRPADDRSMSGKNVSGKRELVDRSPLTFFYSSAHAFDLSILLHLHRAWDRSRPASRWECG
jgi:hypothetical protein